MRKFEDSRKSRFSTGGNFMFRNLEEEEGCREYVCCAAVSSIIILLFFYILRILYWRISW